MIKYKYLSSFLDNSGYFLPQRYRYEVPKGKKPRRTKRLTSGGFVLDNKIYNYILSFHDLIKFQFSQS